MAQEEVARMGTLYREHVLLGASFAPSGEGDAVRAESYPGETGAYEKGRAYLADLTGSTYKLVSGASAQALVEAVFCGKKLAVGECAWEAALTAEGALTSVVLLARTGDNEYALVDPTPRGDVVSAWLGFIASIEQGGYVPYAQTAIEDADGMLTPLFLAGDAARKVLADYVDHVRDLPGPGQVKSLRLDKISALVAGIEIPGQSMPAFLVLVPPARAATIWRSFLSFTETAPVGSAALTASERSLLPWGEELAVMDQVKPGPARLSGWGLLRETMDFVGARALA